MELFKQTGLEVGDVLYTPRGTKVTISEPGVRIDKKGEPLVYVEYMDEDGHSVSTSMCFNKLTYDDPTEVNEVTQKDIKQVHPHDPELFSISKQRWPFDKMTLDNLKALRDKAYRVYRYWKKQEGGESQAQQVKKEYLEYDKEIRKRLAYINKPVEEMATISKDGKQVFANDIPLKKSDLEAVEGNIVFFYVKDPGIFAAGFTLMYFMDSDQSAQDIKNNKIPYLMVPRGEFHSGGSPITAIWKKKYAKPGTEHILGELEGNCNEKEIFIDMITVRPGYQRNSIASKMLSVLKRRFPNATLQTSSKTDQGEKFFKSQEKDKTPEEPSVEPPVDEGYGAKDPETDPLHVPGERWTLKWGSRKTPKMEEGFEPTSVGPNPAASEGGSDPNFYADQITKMRQLEVTDEEIDKMVEEVIREANITQ